jgi:hypothetical protein
MSLRTAIKWHVLDRRPQVNADIDKIDIVSFDKKQRGDQKRMQSIQGSSASSSEKDSDDSSDDKMSSSDAESRLSNSIDSEGSEDEEEDEDGEMSEVQVDFEYYPIQLGDRSSIQSMLGQLLEPLDLPQLEKDKQSKKQFKLESTLLEFSTALTSPLIEDGKPLEESRHHGSTVKNTEEDAPLGLLTILSLTQNPHARAFFDVLRKGNSRLDEFMTKNAKNIYSMGWLLKLYSIVNMPPQVAIPLYKLLLDEMREDPEDLLCDYYCLVTRTFHTVPSQSHAETLSKKTRKSMKKTVSATNTLTEYYYTEDAILAEFADFSCPLTLLPPDKQKHASVPDAKRLFSEDGSEETRHCFIISHANLLLFVNSLEQAL